MRALSVTVVIAALALAPSCGGGEGGDGAGAEGPSGNYEVDVRQAADAIYSTEDRIADQSNAQQLQPELDAAAEQMNAAVTRIEQTNVPQKALDPNQRLLAALWYTRDALEDARLTISDPGNPLPEEELARAGDGIRDGKAALKELGELGYDTRRKAP